MRKYAEKFPEFKLSPDIKTIHDFNDQYITQMYKFKSALEYYQKSSSKFYLKTITTPTMIIQAANDPMVSPETWPIKSDLSNNVYFAGLKLGGHAGFVSNNHNLKNALLKLPETMVQYYRKFL